AAAFGEPRELHFANFDDALEASDALEKLSELVVAALGRDRDRDFRDIVLWFGLAWLEERHTESRGLRRLGHRAVEARRLLFRRKLRLQHVELGLELGQLAAEALQLGHLRPGLRQLRRQLLAPALERRDLELQRRHKQEPSAGDDPDEAQNAEDDLRKLWAVDEALEERRHGHRYTSNRQVTSNVTMTGL